MPSHSLTKAALLPLLTLLTLTALGANANAQDSAEERRKKLIRLGSGDITLPAPVGEVYPLEALIERTMEANPQIIARGHAELFARLRRREANWAHAPVFNITSALTVVPAQSDPNAISSNLEKYFTLDVGPFSASSVKMVIPIFTFGKIDAAQNLAQLGVDQSKLETRKMRLKLTAQTHEAFYSYQLGKHIQALIGDSVGIIRDEIARLEEAREFGDEDVDIEQLRKLQIYETEISAQVMDNQRLIRLTKSALAVLTQLKPGQFDVPAFDENLDTSILQDLATYQDIARKERPDAELLSKAIAARQEQVNLARAKFWPDIFFGADFSVGWSTEEARDQTGFVNDPDGTQIPLAVEPFSNPFNYNRFGFLFGARLNINPVNQYWKLKQSEAQMAETQGLRKAALEGIDLQIEKQWVEVDDHRKKVEIYQRRLKAADRWRSQVGIAFQSGGAEFKDFLAPLKAFYEARLKLLQAQYDFKVGMAKLGEQVGVTNIYALSAQLQKSKPSKPKDK